MDTSHEKMQFLGLFGIYKESHKLIFSWRKIFSQITLTLILPLSFIFLFHFQLSDVLFGKILEDSKDFSDTPPGTSQQQNLLLTLSSDWSTYFLFKLFYFIFFLLFSLLSTSAVVYTVASIYTARDVTFKKVIGVVPKVWKRLIVTFLSTLVAFFVYNVMAVTIVGVWALTLGVRSGGAAILLIIGILYVIGFVYLTVVWQLANVVSVMEESYGFEAMMKSKALIKGKMRVSMINIWKLNVLFFLVEFLFMLVTVKGGMLGLGYMERGVCGIVCFLVLSYLFLLMLVVQTVLYFVCKSYHNEIIDKSVLSDQLQVYECYEPLKAKYVQLDNHV